MQSVQAHELVVRAFLTNCPVSQEHDCVGVAHGGASIDAIRLAIFDIVRPNDAIQWPHSSGRWSQMRGRWALRVISQELSYVRRGPRSGSPVMR